MFLLKQTSVFLVAVTLFASLGGSFAVPICARGLDQNIELYGRAGGTNQSPSPSPPPPPPPSPASSTNSKNSLPLVVKKQGSSSSSSSSSRSSSFTDYTRTSFTTISDASSDTSRRAVRADSSYAGSDQGSDMDVDPHSSSSSSSRRGSRSPSPRIVSTPPSPS